METISVGKGSDDFDNSSEGYASYTGFDETTDRRVRDLARELTNSGNANNQLGNADEDQVDNLDFTSSHPDSRFQLLRTMTSMSQVPGVVPVEESVDPRLDPSSDDFNSKFWVKNMRKLLDSDPDYYKPTSLGFACKNLVAKGISSDADYQSNFLNFPFKSARDMYLNYMKGHDESRYFEILKSMDCLIKPGTLTVVLGRPGAGCSTFLKTVAAQTHGFKVSPDSTISYDGLTQHQIQKNYRGEVIFSAELDNHFPHLTVGQTLEFTALLRTPQNRFPGVERKAYAKHMAEVRTNINTST